jgi:predicted peptidase
MDDEPNLQQCHYRCPQCIESGLHSAANTNALFDLIADIKSTYSINDKRVLLTGYSAGAFGTWSVGANHQAEFTAMMPISDAPRYWVQPDQMPQNPEENHAMLEAMPKITAQWDIPVYVINSHADQNVPIDITSTYINALKQSQPDADVTFVTLDDAAHFDVEPFLAKAAIGYALINEKWKAQK